MSSQFVHLHLHTQYSLLDGANHLDPLFAQVRAFGQPAVAMTDHGNLFGAIQFHQKAQAHGVKPIIGCEAYLAPGHRTERENPLAHNDYYHLILLATNHTGYRNLIKLSSKAYLEGFYYKPRMDKELLQEHHEGLIALSGCLSGEVPHLIGQHNMEAAAKTAGEYQEIFGKEHYYLEVQANGLDHQFLVNRGLVEIHKKLGIPLAGTNDCHYLKQDDAKPHEIMLCLQTGKTLKDENRLTFDTDQLYVKSTDEMARAFSELPSAVLNTCRIAEQCDLQLDFGRSHLPHYQAPEGFTRESYLQKLAEEGLASRLASRPTNIPDEIYHRRLTEELAILTAMGYAGYFLIVWDIIRFARSRGIPVGPGRGSAAGSLVAYCLFITDLDPLVHSLLFERFLNPERVTMPDIDMDFCMDRREEVINYLIDKYGQEHVSQIITFGTLGARAAIRDVARVMNVSYAEADRMAKLVPDQLHIAIKDAIAQEPEFNRLVAANPRLQGVIDNAMALEGLVRHASTHAAGVVVADKPLTDLVPLCLTANKEIVTQFDMESLEKLGLIKFDILGLKTLTVLDYASQLIQQRHPSFSLETLPLDDPGTYRLLASGKTACVFQLESSGMRSLLRQLKPTQFSDLVAVLALYRPGPLESGMVQDFIRRKQDPSAIAYDPAELESALKETYGVIVYQEQVMAIASRIAGFSLAQADLLRRAMGKKKPDEMAKQKAAFLDGATRNGLQADKAETLFEQIAHFAGYGFNKSHSAAYALIAFRTAYLKARYPQEYLAAWLTGEAGNHDKLALGIAECRRLRIPVLPPDINASRREFTIEQHGEQRGIRYGLGAIKHLGEKSLDRILEVRRTAGAFSAFYDACKLLYSKTVNKRCLETLIHAGAFDSFGEPRSRMISLLPEVLAKPKKRAQSPKTPVHTLFDGDTPPPLNGSASAFPRLSPAQQREEYLQERNTLGVALGSTYLDGIRDAVSGDFVYLGELLQYDDNEVVRAIGMITDVRKKTTKDGKSMAFAELEDSTGRSRIILWPRVYSQYQEHLAQHSIATVEGKIQKDERTDMPAIIATKLRIHSKESAGSS